MALCTLQAYTNDTQRITGHGADGGILLPRSALGLCIHLRAAGGGGGGGGGGAAAGAGGRDRGGGSGRWQEEEEEEEQGRSRFIDKT